MPLDPELLEWADVIVAMEASHRTKIAKKFKRFLGGKRIVVVGIPDDYKYMDPTLIDILKNKVPPLLQGRAKK